MRFIFIGCFNAFNTKFCRAYLFRGYVDGGFAAASTFVDESFLISYCFARSAGFVKSTDLLIKVYSCNSMDLPVTFGRERLIKGSVGSEFQFGETCSRKSQLSSFKYFS